MSLVVIPAEREGATWWVSCDVRESVCAERGCVKRIPRQSIGVDLVTDKGIAFRRHVFRADPTGRQRCAIHGGKGRGGWIFDALPVPPAYRDELRGKLRAALQEACADSVVPLGDILRWLVDGDPRLTALRGSAKGSDA